MAKLYFRHGTVGSAKTLNLLAVAHSYTLQGKRPFLIRPRLDVRFGASNIKSRAGLEREADLLIDKETDLEIYPWKGIDCILVDEAQFLSIGNVEQLRAISLKENIPVICYGLRTDFRTHLFEGSRRLMELADAIEEIKSTCFYCHRKSIANLRHVDHKASLSGPTIQLGGEETYLPACFACFCSQLKEVGETPFSSVNARASDPVF